ncbi:MAG: YkgJ family cysteine cluster protein, partial [Planctomycetes bacterium]|nr:YkgJ family cysteine cluster protein [Planctomycetota bacterium]
KQVPPGYFELAKGEGNKCLFLDTDGLCIIHKELGEPAKPHMCRQFPLIPSHTPTDDRVSANYGCPAIQQRSGTPITEQADEIKNLVKLSAVPADPQATVKLAGPIEVSMAESDALYERAMRIFAPDHEGDLWQRFAELLATLMWVGKNKQSADGGDTPAIVDMLCADSPLPDMPEIPPIRAFNRVPDIPTSAKMLFTATLYPDTVPSGSMESMGFSQRLLLIPRLMSLATQNGAYASRLLECNISVRDVMRHDVGERLEDDSTALLLRYFRSRFWQRTALSKNLSLVAGMHQHILDFNAVLFFARAIAHREGANRLASSMIREALQVVEFHLANQYRLYHMTLKKWLVGQLNSPQAALASLRMMALKKEAVAAIAGT